MFLLAPSLAVADVVADRAVIVGRVDDGAWREAPTEARADQRAELAVIVIGHRGHHRVVLAPDGVIVPGHVEPLPSGVEVQWSLVEPHGFRATTATNGATSEFYSNVSTEPKTLSQPTFCSAHCDA